MSEEKFEDALSRVYADLLARQEPLGEEFARVLAQMIYEDETLTPSQAQYGGAKQATGED